MFIGEVLQFAASLKVRPCCSAEMLTVNTVS